MKLIEVLEERTYQCASHKEMLSKCKYMEKLGWKSLVFDSSKHIIVFSRDD